MKLFKVNGRRIAAKTISDAVEAYKAKRIDLDDASASGTAELTDIINDLLQKKEPLDINERVDVNGKRVKGQIRIFWNGGEIQIGFTPKSGDFAMLGKSSSVGVPVDRKTKTVKRSDVNKAAQAIFEFADKQTETQKSLANEKPKLLGYKLEFIEGEQSGIRKRMMNKLVDFDDMVRFLQGEEDRRQSTGAKGYDKAYIDAVYSIGGKHYRVHGARFDVGDGGDVRSRLKAETGYLDKEIEAFRKSGYSRSVKEGDCKDAAGVDFDYLLAEERKAVNDYRTAISQTDDPKLLTVLSHILKEETEHIEELEAARKGVYEDKGLMDAEVLTKQERIRFIEKLTAGLQKSPYNYDKMTANKIAIKRADALDPSWRARWAGDIDAQVRQELRNTAPKDSAKAKDGDPLDKISKTVNELWTKYTMKLKGSAPRYRLGATANGDVVLHEGYTGPVVAKGNAAVGKFLRELIAGKRDSAKDAEAVIYQVTTSQDKMGRLHTEYFGSSEEVLRKHKGRIDPSSGHPRLDGFVGPFSNGTKNGKRVFLYEDKNTYLSMDSKAKAELG